MLTAHARLSLIQSLEHSIANTLAQEANERQQAIEEARRAAGAFPTLAASAVASHPGGLDAHPVNQPHKVLSLNSKTKKVTVSSYTKAQRPPNISTFKGAAAEPVEPEPRRVPRPPPEVPFSSKPQNTDRLWMNVRPGSKPVTYIPPPASTQNKQAESSRRRPKKNARNADGSHQQPQENVEVCETTFLCTRINTTLPEFKDRITAIVHRNSLTVSLRLKTVNSEYSSTVDHSAMKLSCSLVISMSYKFTISFE